MATRKINATVGSLLGFLHDRPQSGWDLVTTAEQRIGDFWSLTRSQVYRELATMSAAGLVEVEEVGPRDRRAYRITDAGRAAFREWLDQVPGQEQIRYPLLLTFVFGRHLPDERLASFVASHRATHAGRLQQYQREREAALGAGVTERDLLPLEFGIRYEKAVLEWFDHLPDAFRPPSPESKDVR